MNLSTTTHIESKFRKVLEDQKQSTWLLFPTFNLELEFFEENMQTFDVLAWLVDNFDISTQIL